MTFKHVRVHPNQPQPDATFTLSLFTFDQHLEGRVLKVGNTSEMKGDDLRLCFLNQEFYFLGDVFSVGEEDPALQSQQQQAGKGLIFGMFLGARPEHVRARLASEHVHRRISDLIGKRHHRDDDRDDDSLQRSYQHHSRKCDQGPGKLGSTNTENFTEFRQA